MMNKELMKSLQNNPLISFVEIPLKRCTEFYYKEDNIGDVSQEAFYITWRDWAFHHPTTHDTVELFSKIWNKYYYLTLNIQWEYKYLEWDKEVTKEYIEKNVKGNTDLQNIHWRFINRWLKKEEEISQEQLDLIKDKRIIICWPQWTGKSTILEALKKHKKFSHCNFI